MLWIFDICDICKVSIVICCKCFNSKLIFIFVCNFILTTFGIPILKRPSQIGEARGPHNLDHLQASLLQKAGDLGIAACLPCLLLCSTLLTADSQYTSTRFLLGLLCRQRWVSPGHPEASRSACVLDLLSLELRGWRLAAFMGLVRKRYWEPQFCVCSSLPFPYLHYSFLTCVAFQNVRLLIYILVSLSTVWSYCSIESKKQSWVNYAAPLNHGFLIGKVFWFEILGFESIWIWKYLLYGIFEGIKKVCKPLCTVAGIY